MQSPWGDGNLPHANNTSLNVIIWEMQSPWGDGNDNLYPPWDSFQYAFEKCSPREGTETKNVSLPLKLKRLFEKCSPREGTETNCQIYMTDCSISYLRNAVPVRGRKLQLIPCPCGTPYAPYLRNAVPVRGRKPFLCNMQKKIYAILFEKCSPREGAETIYLPLL